MRLKKLAAAVAVAAVSFGVQATPYDFGPHDAIEASFLIPGAGIVASGGFLDTYTFSLGAAEVVTSTVVSNNLSPVVGITSGQYTIIDAATLAPVSAAFTFNGTTGSTSHSVALGAGSYAYAVLGAATGVIGYYSLTSTIVPVPEPASLAMLLAGLGVVGFLIKRRQVR